MPKFFIWAGRVGATEAVLGAPRPRPPLPDDAAKASRRYKPRPNGRRIGIYPGVGPTPQTTRLPAWAAIGLCKKYNVRYLNAATNIPGSFNYVLDQIRDGAMLMVGSEETVLAGREHTKRKMPI